MISENAKRLYDECQQYTGTPECGDMVILNLIDAALLRERNKVRSECGLAVSVMCEAMDVDESAASAICTTIERMKEQEPRMTTPQSPSEPLAAEWIKDCRENYGRLASYEARELTKVCASHELLQSEVLALRAEVERYQAEEYDRQQDLEGK